MKTQFNHLLLEWYAKNARKLPWRGSKDPYAVWVSEVMLQQTQVATVIPYYLRWMERFPDIQALAAATEQEVLRLWEGLGYYARARHLWQAANELVDRYDGRLPGDPCQLEKLSGIGRYIAGAIASMAFGLDAPVLDGNIKRVIARVFDIDLLIDQPAGLKHLWKLAEEMLPAGQAGDHNQALMDLGAMVCLAHNPLCLKCPLGEICLAKQNGNQSQRPLRSKRNKLPEYSVAAAVILQKGRVLITRRPSRGLLGGLWEFPGGKQQKGETLSQALMREIQEELGTRIKVGAEMGSYRHTYTHFRVELHAFNCRILGRKARPLEASALAWVTLTDLGEYPMGNIDRRIANDLKRNNTAHS